MFNVCLYFRGGSDYPNSDSTDVTWGEDMDGYSSDDNNHVDYDEFLASVRCAPRRSARRAIKKGCKGHDTAFSCSNCWTGECIFVYH